MAAPRRFWPVPPGRLGGGGTGQQALLQPALLQRPCRTLWNPMSFLGIPMEFIGFLDIPRKAVTLGRTGRDAEFSTDFSPNSLQIGRPTDRSPVGSNRPADPGVCRPIATDWAAV